MVLKANFIKVKNRMAVARDLEWGGWGDVGQKVQTCSYKRNTF